MTYMKGTLLTIQRSGIAGLPISEINKLFYQGRKVRELLDGARLAGTHSATWDGRDAAGNAVSSGKYLAHLKMGNYSKSNRMLLMK
jgi:flagellar hook assembly protein FlgD